jgi:hypothetical protein
MRLRTEPYLSLTARWPKDGRHILAQFDAETVVVYQAFCPQIGHFAAEHGYFGEGFSMSRMSWIKPNFLWMMYRCGWAAKQDQQVVLAITIQRAAFDEILTSAVPSSYQSERHASPEQWRLAVSKSDVRVQWDPDHDPLGNPLSRRAIQLGLRGVALSRYCREWICGIDDISEFVRDQKDRLDHGGHDALIMPSEEIYPHIA